MSSPTAPKKTAASASAQQYAWSRRVRGIVSAVLAFHVAAVFIAPWSGPPPASGLSGTLARWIRPYTEAMNINHGYRFFAPNPGPSHLVRYELLLRDGSVKQGVFPNLDEHWPRQLYHRHFMLAESANNAVQETTMIFPPPPPPSQVPGYHAMTRGQQQQLHREFQQGGKAHNDAKRRLDRLIRPIAERLMLDHDADAVQLWSVEHRIPFRHRFVEGATLEDATLYVERPLGRFQRR